MLPFGCECVLSVAYLSKKSMGFILSVLSFAIYAFGRVHSRSVFYQYVNKTHKSVNGVELWSGLRDN